MRRDDSTVIFHLKEPYAGLLWNLSEGAIGIVPYGSLDEMTQPAHRFRTCSNSSALNKIKKSSSNQTDDYWGRKPNSPAFVLRSCPMRPPELSNCAKAAPIQPSTSLTPDTVIALESEPNLKIDRSPGTILAYLAFNLARPVAARCPRAPGHRLRCRSRAFAPLYLARLCPTGFERSAHSKLGLRSANEPAFTYNPEKARQILDSAGYAPHNGVRFHLAMKTSTEESTRLMAAVLQQQLREVGIALDIRTFEFATFLADVTTDPSSFIPCAGSAETKTPDIFEYVSTPADSLRKVPIAVSIRIRAWMR